MKAKAEIRNFFDNELLDDLRDFDRQKNEVIKDTFKWRVLYISGFLFVFLIFIINTITDYSLGYPIIIGLMISSYFLVASVFASSSILAISP